MTAPIWVIVFYAWGGQEVLRCASDHTADQIVYHNTYYGRRCLKVRVKAWREMA